MTKHVLWAQLLSQLHTESHDQSKKQYAHGN